MGGKCKEPIRSSGKKVVQKKQKESYVAIKPEQLEDLRENVERAHHRVHELRAAVQDLQETAHWLSQATDQLREDNNDYVNHLHQKMELCGNKIVEVRQNFNLELERMEKESLEEVEALINECKLLEHAKQEKEAKLDKLKHTVADNEPRRIMHDRHKEEIAMLQAEMDTVKAEHEEEARRLKMQLLKEHREMKARYELQAAEIVQKAHETIGPALNIRLAQIQAENSQLQKQLHDLEEQSSTLAYQKEVLQQKCDILFQQNRYWSTSQSKL